VPIEFLGVNQLQMNKFQIIDEPAPKGGITHSYTMDVFRELLLVPDGKAIVVPCTKAQRHTLLSNIRAKLKRSMPDKKLVSRKIDDATLALFLTNNDTVNSNQMNP